MKRILWGSLLIFILAACGTSSNPEVPQATNTFSFTVDPAARSVELAAAPAGALAARAEDGSRVLVPRTDLSLKSYTFTFLPGNILAINASFRNISGKTFKNLTFSRAASSDNIVSSSEPDVVETLESGASTSTLRFMVQHQGQRFAYEVDASATVAAPEPGGTECTNPVNIPDDVLRRQIRSVIGKSQGDITCADMASLESLSIESLYSYVGEVYNLEGLQFAVNLTELRVSFTELTDLRPLSGLTSLQGLDVASNKIDDISPLQGLTNLTGLSVANNNISDISAVSDLLRLERLILAFNPITDIGPLSGLEDLQILLICNNRISDLGPLIANPGIGNGDDFIDLSVNPFDLSPGSKASQDIETLERRNPNIPNIFGTEAQPGRCS